MLRVIVPALLAACALPAAAQHCEITRNGAVASFATADIKDTAATRITTETGPIFTKLTLDPAASKAGYKLTGGDKAGLYLYRIGNSVAAKDWREPGSIATTDAGFAVDWPRLTLKGKTVASLGVEFTLQSVDQRDVITIAGDGQRDGAVMRLNEKLPVPRKFADIAYGEDELDFEAIKEDWLDAFPKNTVLAFTLFVPDTKTVIASAQLTYPGFDARQKSLVEDVNALRAAFAAGKCS